jgi:hypothetical protein
MRNIWDDRQIANLQVKKETILKFYKVTRLPFHMEEESEFKRTKLFKIWGVEMK